MADQLNLRSTTFTAGNSWLATYGTNLRDNDLYLGRMRATSGDPVLEQTDCEIGATWVHYTDRLLKTFRISGTGTADDTSRNALASPYRASWHFDDNAGTPPLDNRVVKGDSYIYDTGSGDRYKLHYDSVAGAFKGLGVRADYRTTATSGSTTQDSDAVAWRSSRWVTSAAKYRQWRMVARGSASDTTDSYLSVYSKREEGSECKVFDFEHRYGSISKFFVFGDGAGSTPGIGFTADPTGSSPGSISCVIGPNGTDIDGTEIWFKHGEPTRHARHRFFGVTSETTGADARVLEVSYVTAATNIATTRNSPAMAWAASYYVGPSSIPDARYYAQHVLDSTTPTGHLRFGSDYGVGTFDHYSDGASVFHIDFDGTSTYGGALSIRASTAANASLPTNHSPYFHAIGRSGSSDANRGIAWNTQIDSSADASDLWSMRMVATSSGAPTDVIGIRHTGEILPADVSGHAIEFTTALGTHAKTTASDKTGNAKVGTIKVKLSDGSTAHLQLYAD